MRGLAWLAAVGPASIEAWAVAMGWGETTAYSHTRRLLAAGWVEVQPMTHGAGSLIYATKTGVAMSGVKARALAAAPAPTTWAHCEACAWTAAWLTVRGRTMVGPRKLLASGDWLAEVQWVERHGVRRRGHRPDLIGGVATGGPLLPIEVELAAKSTQRLRAVLGLHARWITTGKARAVIYICATATVAERVSDEARQVGLTAEHTTLRVELLDTIRAAAITARHAHPADAPEVAEPTARSA